MGEGLLMSQDDDNHVWAERTADAPDGRLISEASVEFCRDGLRSQSLRIPTGPLFPRLQRSKGELSVSYSQNSAKWERSIPPINDRFTGPFKVGVIASSAASEPSAAYCEEFRLKTVGSR